MFCDGVNQLMNEKALSKIELKNTLLSIKRFGLGLAALGRPGYINLGHASDLDNNYNLKKMEKHTHMVLDHAWKHGVRYFDAARSYGRAEQFLGSWLRYCNIKPNEVTIGSKWGYSYTADWKINAKVHEVKEHSIELLEKQWKESQYHLGPWLKLYQIHSATIESGVLDNSKVLKKLAQIKSDNIAIGLSLSGVGQTETLEKALRIEVDGIKLFDAVQATWNLLEKSAGHILMKAQQQGLAVIIKEGLANGRLTDRNQETNFKIKKNTLSRIARELDTKVDALALASILKQPWVNIVLSGAATVEQLESNLQAVKLTHLPDFDIAEQAQVYWDTRSSMTWN